MAAPKPAIPPRALAATFSQEPVNPESDKCVQLPEENKKAATPIPNTSATLAMVTTNAVRPPALTDKQLMAATTQIAASATNVRPLSPKKCQASNRPSSATFMKMANPTASAACEPA